VATLVCSGHIWHYVTIDSCSEYATASLKPKVFCNDIDSSVLCQLASPREVRADLAGYETNVRLSMDVGILLA